MITESLGRSREQRYKEERESGGEGKRDAPGGGAKQDQPINLIAGGFSFTSHHALFPGHSITLSWLLFG